MKVYCRLKVLKLVVSVHIRVSTQNELGKPSMSLTSAKVCVVCA